VPPPGERGWDHRASAWLLDHCPPDYRLYPAWRRHPIALAWFTVRHLDAQLDAMRSAYREVRVDLVDDIGPEGVAQVLADLECEGVRLLSARRAAGLLDPAVPVVTYCWGPGCNGATRAALALSLQGYAVKEMLGGVEYWAREGFALRTPAGEVARETDPLVAPCGC